MIFFSFQRKLIFLNLDTVFWSNCWFTVSCPKNYMINTLSSKNRAQHSRDNVFCPAYICRKNQKIKFITDRHRKKSKYFFSFSQKPS